MRARAIFVLVIGVVAVALAIATLRPRPKPARPEPPPAEAERPSRSFKEARKPPVRTPAPEPTTVAPSAKQATVSPAPGEAPAAATNKLERLNQIRETFRALAAGDATAALRAAKQLTDETERETALMTLVAEWTHGELGPSRQRAQAISMYGLEAGLGLELAKNPELAVLWANELTDGRGRSVLLRQAAVAMAGSDQAAAFALSEQLPPNDRRQFTDAVYAGWAQNDTAAALQWANQLADPAEREAAMQAIRSVAPVGIGAELRAQDGYPVINRLFPGMPADLSGQLQAGDRILGIAQGDNSFVDARSLSLGEVVQMIRGAPGSLLQLQVLPADAPPGTPPRTVSIIRDQIKYKR